MEIIENLNFSDYLANKALGSSDIKLLLDSPLKYIHRAEKESKALELGTLFHKLVLEPFDYETTKKAFIDTAKTKTTKEKNEALVNQVERALTTFSKSEIFKMFLNGKNEVSYFKELENVPCKCRCDNINTEAGLILDLKTTSKSASPSDFLKNVANYGYYIQAQFYKRITGAKNFYFVVVELNEPYTIGVYSLDTPSLDFANDKINEALEIFKNLDKFKKPYYVDKKDYSIMQTLTLPTWVYYT